MSNDDPWLVQTSIKHGPGQSIMTNLRGYTVSDVCDQVEDFAEKYEDLVEAIAKVVAADAIFDNFPETERDRGRGSRGRNGRGGGRRKSDLAERDGELCEPHGLPMRYKSGRSKQGNNYELLECTAKRNPCDAIWPDRD